MISTAATPPAAIILDIPKDNWSQRNQAFKLLCYTTFGVAGQQVLSDRLAVELSGGVADGMDIFDHGVVPTLQPL